MKSSDVVCWVTPVGADPSIGGGVARAVDQLKKSDLLKKARHRNLSSYGKYHQLFAALVDVFFKKHTKFLLHSFFSPYSLVILTLPVNITVVLLPHGELKSGALKISQGKKEKIIRILSWFQSNFTFSKKIKFIASNNEELCFAQKIFKNSTGYIIEDIVTENMLLQTNSCRADGLGINIVIISRLVENKRVSNFLAALATAISGGLKVKLEGVYLFCQPEDIDEVHRVESELEKLRSHGLKVTCAFGKSPVEIKKSLMRIPNKLPVLPSAFESFGYTLIETLCFEYRPIVYFDNELVESLMAKHLCVRGSVSESGLIIDARKVVSQNVSTAKKQIEIFEYETVNKYTKVFNEVLLNDV